MATKNALKAVHLADNLAQTETTQLPLREVKNLLDMWFEELKKPSDSSRIRRLDQNLSPANQKLLDRLEKIVSQDEKKLLEKCTGAEPLSKDDYKQLEQLKENLSAANQKLIDRLLKVQENPSQLIKLKTRKDEQTYFDRLNQALEQIKQSKCYPPYLETPYLEQLRSKNNSYDFAATLEQAIDGTLHFENEIEPEETFLLHYFHYQQLQQAAACKWFSTTSQIGKVSA